MALIPLFSCSRDVVRGEVRVGMTLRFENSESSELVDSIPWVHTIFVSETYPLIPMVYFDAGVDTLGAYYKDFMRRYRPELADSLLIGGTITKNRHLLDILGWRLTNVSTGYLLLEPTHTTETGESPDCARRRAEAVRSHLMNRWDIDPDRLRIAPSRLMRCSEGDTVCSDDLRGVRLSSNDLDLLRTITYTEWRRFRMTRQFHASVEVSGDFERVDSAYLSWERKDGEDVRLPLETRGIVLERGPRIELFEGTFSLDENLLRYLSDGASPVLIDTARATASVHVDGELYESRSVEVVEKEVMDRGFRQPHPWKLTYRFSLILFDRDSASLEDAGRKVLRDHVLPIFDTAKIGKVTITGFTSTGEAPELGDRRARTVFDAMMAMGFKPDHVAELTVTHRDTPMYPQGTPHGRALQRTVEIVLRGDM